MASTFFELNIRLGDAAMQTPTDVMTALTGVVIELNYSPDEFPDKFQNIKDINGNIVGTYGIRIEDE